MNHAQFWGGGGAAPYEIEQSLRFDGSNYLNRTPGSAGNRRTWTLSFWFKRGALGTYVQLFSASDNYGSPSSANYFYISISGADDKMYVQQVYPTYNTALDFSPAGRVFRDPSAWYHVVLAIDTTQATGSNRQKMWINGELQTLVNGTSGGPTTISQNYDTTVNTTNEHRLGRYTSVYHNGYLAEVNFIDGSALDHEDFGEFDDNGVWRPIQYAGSYTGQSWYLKFDASDVDGDSSGLGNNWTASAGISTSGAGTDVMSDTPTTNYCTWNPITTNSSGVALSDGNLFAAHAGTNDYGVIGTVGVTSGKWYWEGQLKNFVGYRHVVGVTHSVEAGNPNLKDKSGDTGFWGSNITSASTFYIYENGSVVNYSASYPGSTPSSDSIMQFALDLDNLKWYIGFDGNWYNSGDPAAGTNATSTGLTSGQTWFPICELRSDEDSHWNFGQRAFAYTPPTGFKALNTSNLPAPDIADGSQYFQNVLWSGDGATSRDITTNFSPDWAIIKQRDDIYGFGTYDIVRGGGKFLRTDGTDTETTNPADGYVSAFNSTSVTLAKGSYGWNVNGSGYNYVGWFWEGGGSGSSNTAGSITSTVSASPSSGFSVVSYTGNNTSGATWGHGLGVAPDMVIIKHRDSTYNWVVYHTGLSATAPEDNYIALNDTGELAGSTTIFASTAPTSTTFTVGDLGQVNASNQPYIAYCFAEVEGYSKFGNYVGNDNADGPFIYTGFKPAWVMVKSYSSGHTYNWVIVDAARDPYNVMYKQLFPNNATSESTGTSTVVDFLSNGFKWRYGANGYNGPGVSYIFAAFAENPFGGSGVSPATAR